MDQTEISIELLNNRIYLDQKCWACGTKRDKSDCEYCKGKGFMPTANGYEILAFMLRHSKLEE